MAYVRPAILTVGDVVSEAYMTQLRDNAIAYETHGHTSSSVDGLEFPEAELFGDGSDGDETISSNGNLAAHKQWTNLTVNTGITLDTKGYVIRVTGTLTLTGTAKIINNGGAGGNASSSTAGGGGAGAVGQGALINAGNGGQGSDSGQTTVQGASSSTLGHGAGADPSPLTGRGYSGFGVRAVGGGGGSGGNSSGGTNAGGGGGGGGGPVEIYARTITGSGSIESQGGTGGNGFDGSGTFIGGNGGGGGQIIVITIDAVGGSITYDVSGGAGGTGSTSGGAGNAGSQIEHEIGVALTP